VDDQRLAKRLRRIDRDLGVEICRQPQPGGPPVVAVGDPLQ
jgi:hypothetical protein